MDDSKSRWLSKTFWMGLITSLVGVLGIVFPEIQAWYMENSELVAQGISFVFIILGLLGVVTREATAVPIKKSLFGKDKK